MASVALSSLFLLNIMLIIETKPTGQDSQGTEIDPKNLPKFGCPLDNAYNLETPLKGIWSEEDLRTVVFKNNEEFKKFLAVLNEENDRLLEANSYNTVDNLIAFWQDSKNSTLGFTEFYESYAERVKPRDGAFFTIELLKRVIRARPDYADKIRFSYLSTCTLRSFVFDLMMKLTKRAVDEDVLPLDHFHDHVLGFMKIQIGEASNRTGLIVMDPGMALNDIIVLMDDEYDENNQERSIGNTRMPGGVVHYYDYLGAYINTRFQPAPKYGPTRELCYVKKAYCAFEETTRKPWLVTPEHVIKAHDENGDSLGGISVRLYEEFLDSKSNSIEPRIRLWTRDEKDKKLKENFRTIGSEKGLEWLLNAASSDKMITAISKNLKMSKAQLISLITELWKMALDKAFIEEIKKLNKAYRSKGLEPYQYYNSTNTGSKSLKQEWKNK